MLPAWADSSEPDYGTPSDYFECPECGKEIMAVGDWGDDRECPECKEEIVLDVPDMIEANCYVLNNKEYKAECGESGDIFIVKSPYYTFAQFCSPCAPGACYLMNPLDVQAVYPAGGHNKAGVPLDNNRAYCFGHEWFWDTETKKAPYPVYRVSDGSLIE